MSKESNSSAASGGIGLGGVLFVVFLVLKLAEIGVVATWSWWWVTSPLWIPFLVIGGLFAVFGGGAWIVVSISDAVRSRKRMRAMMKD